MTDEEYQALVARIYSGALLVGIDRSMARKFYTEIPLSRVKEETGEAPYLEKFIVFGSQIAGLYTLVASFVLAILAFSWWALVAIPVSALVYSTIVIISSRPGSGLGSVSVLLGLALIGIYFNWFTSEYAAWYAVLVASAFWLARLTYVAAARFVRGFVVRNRRAYEFLAPHIHLRDA